MSPLEGLVRIHSSEDIAMLLNDRLKLTTSCLIHQLMNWNGTGQFQYHLDHHHQTIATLGNDLEELPRLDPSKLQYKSKRDKRKCKQDEDHISRRSKRHRTSTGVKLVEIVELSGSESDVDDDTVKRVEKVERDAMGIEDDKVKRIGRYESGGEIGNEGDNVGNKSDTVEVECEMENDGKAAGVYGEMENDSNAAGVEGKIEIDGQAAEGVGIQPRGAYVPQFTENTNTDFNIEVEWEAFLERHQDDIWNSWEDGLRMNNEEEPQPAAESEEHEVQRDFKKGLWTQTSNMKKSLYQHKILNLVL
ncbi:Uncharacterized protein Fot_39373 [Forsythia ovata]|uniref:Uncharacterized protein n=1 Tax=Forsythia ovata TaxID=205694 RepID=A0ABD1S546_9LAMI